jgi:hypothetical protein
VRAETRPMNPTIEDQSRSLSIVRLQTFVE